MHAPVHDEVPPVENPSKRREKTRAAFVAIAGVRNHFAMPGQQIADSALEKPTRLFTKATSANTATAIPTGDQDLDREEGGREVLAEAVYNLHIADLPGNTCTYL